MDNKVTTTANPALVTPLPLKEEPLVELRWKKWLYYFTILGIIWLTWFEIFGVIIPYLTTGDFNEIWPAHKDHASRKAFLFAISWIWLLAFFVLGLFHSLKHTSSKDRISRFSKFVRSRMMPCT